MRIITISNMYPSKKDPVYGTFVRNFYEDIKKRNHGGRNDLIVIKGRQKSKVWRALSYIGFYTKIFFYLLFRKYDIVYVHTITYPIIPIVLISLIKPIPLVFNVHGRDVLNKNRKVKLLQHLALPIIHKSKLIVSPSEYFKDVLIDVFPNLDKHKIFVSPSGGISKAFFNSNLKVSNEPFRIGYVSRIDFDKGWDVLLKGIERINEKGYNFEVIMAGRGKDEHSLILTLKNSDIADRVKYIGPVGHDQLPGLYKSFDLFVFPTRTTSESLGLVGLEAMAASVPVIASNIGGPGYYVVDGENGFKFATNSDKDLALKIIEFMELPEEEKRKMKEKAFETAEQYASEKVAENLYSKLVSLLN